MDGTLSYDKSKLTFVSMSGCGSWSTPSYNAANGKFVTDRGDFGKSSEAVFRITFRANEGQSGNTTIGISGISIADGNEESTVQSASKTILVNTKSNNSNSGSNSNGNSGNTGNSNKGNGNNKNTNQTVAPVQPNNNAANEPEMPQESAGEENTTNVEPPEQEENNNPEIEEEKQDEERKDEENKSGIPVEYFCYIGIGLLVLIGIGVVSYIIVLKNKENDGKEVKDDKVNKKEKVTVEKQSKKVKKEKDKKIDRISIEKVDK